ncbi:gustatory receptor [Homalodisca vitripennis]|nr:gustatory receptor [Homalodisca vitripennis]
MLTEVVTFYSCARSYTNFLDICVTLERVDYRLQLTPSKCWMTVKFTALICVIILTPIIAGGMSLYHILKLTKDHELIISRIILYSCSIATYYFQVCILVQFHEVTHCIATRFRLINARIRQEVIIQSYRQSVLRQYPRCINRGQDRNSNNKIKTFMSAYQMLCEAVDKVNAFYCDPLLSIIFYRFVYVTFTLYALFLCLVSENPLGHIKTPIWLTVHICYLLQIVSSSSDVTQAADETSPIICKLINKDLDAGLKRQLDSFLLQLAFQNVEFCAKGGFKNQDCHQYSANGSRIKIATSTVLMGLESRLPPVHTPTRVQMEEDPNTPSSGFTQFENKTHCTRYAIRFYVFKGQPRTLRFTSMAAARRYFPRTMCWLFVRQESTVEVEGDVLPACEASTHMLEIRQTGHQQLLRNKCVS